MTLPTSALTAKDVADLQFGLNLGIDLVALSFVQTPDDVRMAASHMSGLERPVPIIAKVERPAAIDNLPEILKVAQGVMVARGDLGLELPYEQVPRVQKEIIRCARTMGRPVIVATQVLDSMRVEPRPTRAEVSDAAKAVDEGVDAIMLTGETAAGLYPVEAVRALDIIIRDAESIPQAVRFAPAIDPGGLLHSRALCESAVTLATTGHADAIIAVTRGGKTARLLSALRPRHPDLRRDRESGHRLIAGALLGSDAGPDRGARCREARGAGPRAWPGEAGIGGRLHQRAAGPDPRGYQFPQRAADRLVPWNRDSWDKSRSAAPGGQGERSEHIGHM